MRYRSETQVLIGNPIVRRTARKPPRGLGFRSCGGTSWCHDLAELGQGHRVDADVLIDDEFHPGQHVTVTLLFRQTFPPVGFSPIARRVATVLPFDLSM
jgi:hypothetical protein